MNSKERSGPVSLVVVEEIALEGLEGITIDGLWKRLSPVLQFSLPLEENFQSQVWSFIKQSASIFEFYTLPESREELKVFNRWDHTEPDLGEFNLTDECPFTRYKLSPVEFGENKGSCEFYHQRIRIPVEEINEMSLEDVLKKWGHKFVIVAVQHIREYYLFPEYSRVSSKELILHHYCVLEAIGRSRYNGEVTCGKHSLLYMFKDSASLFFVKNRLVKYKLILKEQYCEKIGARQVMGQILTLPRYYTDCKSKSMYVIETLYNLIKSKDNEMMSAADFREQLPPEYRMSLKKIVNCVIFKKCFVLEKLSYRDVFPESLESEYLQKSKSKEKSLTMWKLKDPNMKLKDLFLDEDGKDEEDINSCSTEFYYIDMPLIEQVYQYVNGNGTEGASQSSINKAIGLTRSVSKAVLKKLVDDGSLKVFKQDIGRQRTGMYITAKNAKLREEMLMKEKKGIEACHVLNDISTFEEQNGISAKPSTSDNRQPEESTKEQQVSADSDIKEIEVTIRPLLEPNYKIDLKKEQRLTQRQTFRKTVILSVVKSKQVIDFAVLYKILKIVEEKRGYKDEICKKSLMRLIFSYIHEKVFSAYEVILAKEDYMKEYKFVSLSSVYQNDAVFQNEIMKCKTHFHLNVLDKQHRMSMVVKKMLAQTEKESPNKSETPKETKTSQEGLKTPKFLKAQYYHEFFVYMVYEMDREVHSIPVTEDIKNSWLEQDNRIDMDDLLHNFPSLYSTIINWKMFISPLPKYSNVPSGWIAVKDIFSRLPLSLVAKANWIDRTSNDFLQSYLNHPIKQHFLIHNIPEIATELYNKNVTFNQTDEVIRLLEHMGLVQLGLRMFKEIKKSWVYINKTGKLLDTSSSDQGYNKISPNMEYPEEIHHFNNTQSVLNYWNNLYKIASTTKLGFKSNTDRIPMKRKYLSELKQVKFPDAPLRDVGYIPGDNLGAAGLDSQLYVHLKRNWSWRIKKLKSARPVAYPSIKIIKKKDIVKKKTTIIKRAYLTVKKVKVRRIAAAAKKKKLRQEYDSIDREALKHMNSLRVQWTPEEDRILKVCRAVFLYLGDPKASRSVQYFTIRDILQWSIGSMDKTAKACHRRFNFLTKYKKDVPDTAAWLHELKQNQYISKFYGSNFIRDLKRVFVTEKEYSMALKLHFIKLVSFLLKILRNLDDAGQNKIILPDTLNQFHMLYEITQDSIGSEKLKHTEPRTISDIEVYTINGMIHSCVCCTKDKTVYNIQLFDIYKMYSDDVLQVAFNKVRSDHLVVAPKAKTIHNYSQKLIPMGPTLILSVKYRQQLFIGIPYTSISEFHQTFETYLFKTFCRKEPFEFTGTDGGTCLFFAEACTNLPVSIKIQLPVRILTVDPHQEKCKESERILEHFRRLFENAPKTEYIKNYEEACSDVVEESGTNPRLRFDALNESYKLFYHPYDTLIRLHDDYFHFFCAINSLNKEVNLDRLHEEHLCPFECILNQKNYIDEISQILEKSRETIVNLSENNECFDEIEKVVTVTPENVVHIFLTIFDVLRSRSMALLQKDLGKTDLKPQAIDIIDLTKKLLDYTVHNCTYFEGEFIPSLNKEDKIIKAQDIFVVNLPKITFSQSNEHAPKSQYKNFLVPSNFIELGFEKQKIIEKITREYIFPLQCSTMETLEEDMNAEGFTVEDQALVRSVLDFIDSDKLGVTSTHLLKKFPEENSLIRSVSILRSHGLIERVGVEHFTYVHRNHIRSWVVHTYHIKRLEKESLRPNEDPVVVGDDAESKSAEEEEPPRKKPKQETSEKCEKETSKRQRMIMRPCPWMRANGSLNTRVLDKWIGSILLECITLNGLTAFNLCVRFNMLHPVNILFLLEILQDIGCISLKSKSSPKPTLFSKYQDPVIKNATEFTEKENIFIIVSPDAITRMNMFIGDRKYKVDFI